MTSGRDTEKPSQVEYQLTLQAEAVQALSNVVCNLQGRLHVVLRDTPAEHTKEDHAATIVTRAVEIRDNTDSIVRVTAELDDIINRCEL